jgi:hypothetical protein
MAGFSLTKTLPHTRFRVIRAAIQGDTGGNLNPWGYSMGNQTIEARPFTNPNGNGTQGSSFIVNITINP